MSHKSPWQVERLIRALVDGCPGCAVAIHHDPRGPALDPAVGELPGVHVLGNAAPVSWGDWSQVEAALRCFKRLLLDMPTVEWIVQLSGQDYPVRSLRDFAEHLGNTQADAHVRAEPVYPDQQQRRDYLERYYFAWYRLGVSLRFVPTFIPGWINSHQRRVLWYSRTAVGDMLGIARRQHPFTQVQLYKGSQWVNLRRPVVEALLSAYQNSPLTTWFRRTLIPDEAWLHTIVLNDGRFHVDADNGRLEEFTAEGAMHPRVFALPDLQMLKGSGAYFARKLDESPRSPLLDALDGAARA